MESILFTKKHGFTLVELSIVLVILGLIAGGIISGQALIRSANLKAISSEQERYRVAIQTFHDKYQGLPGDINNALEYWAVSPGATCPGVRSNAHTGKQTCNGNGNRQVNVGSEGFNAWQQLAISGMLEGAYTGVTYHDSDNTKRVVKIGWNVPESKVALSGWLYEWKGAVDASDSQDYEGTFGNALFFGRSNTTDSTLDESGTFQPALKPEEAWAIDKKLDDGKPTTGIVTARKSTSCVSSSEYAVNLTTLVCALAFKE